MTTKKTFLDYVERTRHMKNPGGLPFYRCTLCRGIVSVWDLKELHQCGNCGCTKMSPTNLSLKEKIVQIAKHPKVWRWKDVEF